MAVYLKRDRFVWDKPYKELRYIKSTGTQYVDTGIIANQNTRVIVECQADSLNSGGSAIFGTRTSFQKDAFAVFIMPDSVFYNYGNSNKTGTLSNALDKLTIDANSNVCTVKNTAEISVSMAATTFETSKTILLMSCRNGEGLVAEKATWKGPFISCRIYDYGVLVRNYIAAEMKESGEIGLWDKVDKKFYGNAGTGEFVAGVAL